MESTSKDSDFIPYPTNRVVGTIDDAKSARAAIEALLEAGFERDDIDVLHGQDDLSRLDPSGEEHGFLAQFQRAVMRAIKPNEEYRHLARHVEDVNAGRFVVMVLARGRDQRLKAADVLSEHGAQFVGFYGRWAWSGLPPEAQTAGGPVAERPEQIVSLFVEAWMARDADALAALFEEDAEFVNVAGLWWHDRAAIRKAHAYGLSRIFNESTLSVEETRLKELGPDAAVVHAKMRLAGQTPVADNERPGPRTTIFTFVVRRTGERWLCASAHNTDVVPAMETNIVSEDGTMRGASYRDLPP